MQGCLQLSTSDLNVCLLQTEGNLCLAYYEHQCAGICSSEQRLEPIYDSCLKDPLNKGQNQRTPAKQ